jgi:hypothetical protein
VRLRRAVFLRVGSTNLANLCLYCDRPACWCCWCCWCCCCWWRWWCCCLLHTSSDRAHTGACEGRRKQWLSSNMQWLRTAVGSFALGFSVAAVGGMYAVRNDLWESHRLLAAQVRLRSSWFSACATPLQPPSGWAHSFGRRAKQGVFSLVGCVKCRARLF